VHAIIKAWEMAKKKLGSYITLYILTSQATEASNPVIVPMYPKDVRIWYYNGRLTYQTMRRPMMPSGFTEAAKSGQWVGVCPSLDAWTHSENPFTGAAFVKYRMDEFVSKGLKGLLGYATPRVNYSSFNVEAAAEWSWNLRGRTTKDFAYSYAVRQGYKAPALFAEWSETICPVAWDVYGSAWPLGQTRSQGVKVKTALKDGTLPPFGFVFQETFPTPWGNINSERQLNADVAAAKKAIQIAKQLEIPQYTYEALIVDGYLRSLNALYGLKKLAPNGGAFAPDDLDKV